MSFVRPKFDRTEKAFKAESLEKCFYGSRCRKHFSLMYKDCIVPSEVNDTFGNNPACYSTFNALKQKHRLDRNTEINTSSESIPKIIDDANKSSVSVLSSPPSVPSIPGKYCPSPYTFRIPKNTATPKNGFVKCPPFYLQLDHTLAVIWTLFSKQKLDKKLGIVQLQWAQNFLKGIHGKEGNFPPDVSICIDVIEDVLIEHYASLVDKGLKPKKSCCCFPSKKSKSEIGITGSSNAITPTQSNVTLTNTNEGQIIAKQLAFSVNYAEMLQRTPKQLENIFTTPPGITSTLGREGLNVRPKSSTLVTDSCFEGASRADMVDFLMAWRKEQIGKIQQELTRLHSIENFIGNVDKDNFQPYLDNQQLDVLVAQKVSKPKTSGNSSSRGIISKKSSYNK